MPQPSYPFANIRVKAKEKSLLKREDLERLAAAPDGAAAMAVLADFGYPGAEETKPTSFERCLTAELRAAYAFVREISPDTRVTDLFFLQTDYHNLKAILKSQVQGIGAAQRMLLPGGTIDSTTLFEAVTEKRYDDFPPEMREALKELDRRFAVQVDVSQIGLLLDAAYARQITRELRDVKEEFVRRYFEADFDFVNVSALLRLKRLDAGRELAERTLLEGGLLPREELLRLYDLPMEEMQSALAKGQYQKEFTQGFAAFRENGSFAALVKARDDYLTRLCAQYREDLFGISPVLAYLVGKLRETQAVRMILIGILNRMDMRQIMDSIPEVI